MKCGIVGYLAHQFPTEYKKRRYYKRYLKDMKSIITSLISEQNCSQFIIFNGTGVYSDFAQTFKKIAPLGVSIQKYSGKDYVDYLMSECDYVFLFWQDVEDDYVQTALKRVEEEKKNADLYCMEDVTDEMRKLEKFLINCADKDRKKLLTKSDKKFLKEVIRNSDR